MTCVASPQKELKLSSDFSHRKRHLRQLSISSSNALANFHRYKDAIIQAGGQRNDKGHQLNHFIIPKLEIGYKKS